MSGGAIGAALGLITPFAQAGMQQAFSRDLQSRAFDHQIEMMKNAVQWRVQDMRAAGINPILAVAPGAGGAYPAAVGTPGGAPGSPISSAREGAVLRNVMRQQKEKAQQEEYNTATAGQAMEQSWLETDGKKYDVQRRAAEARAASAIAYKHEAEVPRKQLEEEMWRKGIEQGRIGLSEMWRLYRSIGE